MRLRSLEIDPIVALMAAAVTAFGLAFGLGPHRCIGSHLARVMFEVMVKAVLDRIPDYHVDVGGVHQYLGNPSMTGLGKLPVTFTPGVSLGTSRPD